MEAPLAVIIGEEEVKSGMVNIKNTISKEQVTVPLNEILPCLDALLRAMEAEYEHEHDCDCGCGHHEGEEHECKCGHHHDK